MGVSPGVHRPNGYQPQFQSMPAATEYLPLDLSGSHGIVQQTVDLQSHIDPGRPVFLTEI